MLANISPKKSSELKKLGNYIKQLPPKKIAAHLFLMLPEDADFITSYWSLVGTYIDAFFTNKSNPLKNFNLDTETAKTLKIEANYYIQFSLIAFEAEDLIRDYVESNGWLYPFKSRIDLIKAIVLEDCFTEIEKLLSPFWETYSTNQLIKRIETFLKNGAVTKKGCISTKSEDVKEVIGIFLKEDAKLTRIDFEPEKYSFWNNICVHIFWEHRSSLISWNAYNNAIKQRANLIKQSCDSGLMPKRAYQYGKKIISSNRRGKGKKKNS